MMNPTQPQVLRWIGPLLSYRKEMSSRPIVYNPPNMSLASLDLGKGACRLTPEIAHGRRREDQVIQRS